MSHPLPLSRSTLAQLPSSVVAPGYDLSKIQAGIVHLGLGGFHRAHMARYTHDLMQLQSEARAWGIVGVGLLEADRHIWDALTPQDGLYTLIERQDDDEIISVIGALHGVIYAGESSSQVLVAIDDPGVRIVSLTVTENGYCLDPATKQLAASNPTIQHDLLNGAQPRSAIGLLVEAYRRRRLLGLPAFTALSCDNIQGNGLVLHDAVIAMAELQDRRLADWIDANASFPSTMVDRITPITTEQDRTSLASRHALADRWPVCCEMFRQWVIEDRFRQGRPQWEAVGAQFVTDVAPYEYMKLRLLNASHSAIAALGQLVGYVHVDETMRDDMFQAYMEALMDRETGPTLPLVPGIDLARYKAQLLSRFTNPKIQDTLQRINTDAPINLLLDPIRDILAKGQDCALLTLALAAWMKRCAGIDDRGQSLTIRHPQAELLRARALEGGIDPRPLLTIRSLFGDLVENTGFVENLGRCLATLHQSGTRATMISRLTEPTDTAPLSRRPK